MDCSVKVSPQAVVRALETLNDDKTEELVFHLGVETFTIDNIRISFTGSSRKIHLVQAWLDKDTDASWEKIVSGLKQIRMPVLAKEIATQHCQDTTVPSADPSKSVTIHKVQHDCTPPVEGAITPMPLTTTPAAQPPNPTNPPSLPSVETVAKVKATILHLEKMFSGLITTTRSALCKKESLNREFLDEFRDHLLVLPVAKKATHVKFFRESEDDIIEAKSIRKIFAILSRYWSYCNYEILHHIIISFCEALLGNMQEYCTELEKFEMETTVDVYICVMPPDKELEVAFSKMVLKIDKPSSQCTLYDIRKLNEAITEGSSLCSHSVYVSSVTTNCVVVVVRFPSSAAGWVMAAMTPDFMHTHHLIEVAMDGEYLTIIEEDELHLVCVFTFVLLLCCVVLPCLRLAPPPQH